VAPPEAEIDFPLAPYLLSSFIRAMNRFTWSLLYLFVFLTGAAGLIYQVVWQQYLARILGSEHAATAIVLAIFLGGLATGYLMSGALSRYVRNCFGTYAVLEGIIGAWALAFPWLFRWVDNLTARWSFAPPWILLAEGSITAAALIAMPTICMGGTVPLLTRALSESVEAATSVHARIYAINTLGAFVGTIAAGFVLVPLLGLPDTLRTSAALNLAAAAFFAFRARAVHNRNAVETETRAPAEARRYPVRVLYGVAFLSGAYVMTLENVLIRTTDLAVGPSTASFSLIVGVFVLCIGAGSLIVGAAARLSARALVWNQIWLSAALLVIFTTLDKWPYAAHVIRVAFQPNPSGFWAHKLAVLAGLTLLLATPIGLAGATLPIAFHELRRNLDRVGWFSGLLFFWNLIGAVAGSLIGGWLLYLWMNNGRIFLLASAFASGSALLAATARGPRLALVAAVPLLAAIALLVFQPMYNQNRFAIGTFRALGPVIDTWHGPTDFYARLFSKLHVVYCSDGPGATVAVVDAVASTAPATPDGRTPLDRAIYVNGKSDSSTYADRETLKLLAHLGPLFAKHHERALLIGLGTGVSAGELALWPDWKKIVVAELLPNVSAALPYFSEATYGVQNDARLEVRLGDAFRVLRRSPEKWDVILSEPPNLWVRGTSQLFSRDFYAIVKARLDDGGVFVQWLEGFTINQEILERVEAALRTEFPHVTIFRGTPGDFLFVASAHDLTNADLERAAERIASTPRVADSLKAISVATAADFSARRLRATFVGRTDTEPETLDQPRLHYLAGWSAFMPDQNMQRLFEPAPASPP
jgi:spermidine synthase